MNVKGIRRYTVSLDEQPQVKGLGVFACGDENEIEFNVEVKNNEGPVDCTDASVVCRIIFNPKSVLRSTFVWSGVGQNGGVSFTLPKEAHARDGAFALYVSITTDEMVYTVFYGSGTLVDKQSDAFITDEKMSLEELLRAYDTILGMAEKLESMPERMDELDEKTSGFDERIVALNSRVDALENAGIDETELTNMLNDVYGG